MVFGLFTRKPTLDDASPSPESRTNDRNARLPTPTPSIASVARPSPLRFSTAIRAVLGGGTTNSTLSDPATADGGNRHSLALPPPETPSPPPASANETNALFNLMLTIPPKTLHAYTLAHLRPRQATLTSPPALGLYPGNTPRPPSPGTVTRLTAFFSTLTPPPLLHCIRCHKEFYEVENEEKDKACRVPHDDDSALVSRVSGASGGGYETLWSCCEQTTSGNGGEGPPDGWCYEGRHTTDIKRARFRADSTIYDDKLTSCLKLNCRGIRDQFPRQDIHTSPFRNTGTSSTRKSNPSPVRSQASRKRPRKPLKEISDSENEINAESSVGRVEEKVGRSVEGGNKDTSMVIDESSCPSKPREKAKSRPISRPHLPASTSTTTSLPASDTHIEPVVSSKARAATAKSSHVLLSQSHTHLASDSEASTCSRPRTRSHVREESRVRDTSRSRPTSKLTKTDFSERTRRARRAADPLLASGQAVATGEQQESDQEGRGRNRKKRRVGRD